MDTTIGPKKERRESEPTLEKPSPGKHVLKEGEYLVDGKVTLVAPDLKELEEFDWDAPENGEWIESENRRLRDKFHGMDLKKLDEMMSIREEIRRCNPNLSMKDATELALKQSRRKST